MRNYEKTLTQRICAKKLYERREKNARLREILTIENAKKELTKKNVGTSLFKEVYSVIKAVDGARAPSAEELLVSAVERDYALFFENVDKYAGKIVITDLQGLCTLADSRLWTAFKYAYNTCPPTKRGFRIYEVAGSYHGKQNSSHFFTKEHFLQLPEEKRKRAKIYSTLLLVPHALPGE